ncbi:dynein axonemal intermediate chain 4-like [Penaeus chinensis]|uniref:dynein axonemal intermediate chain 4-like n=1 Tax=Penaeus chinensis TaxID=139456 RepID=UPI001FB5D58F|nr:dynein axonemal intermediate chain 4-like [Penaeus chinensis]
MAVYGSPSFQEAGEGALCGWSAKRMGQPEVRIRLPGPATVVNSCPWAPHLCCVAMLDGALHVYQLDTPTPQLVMDTSSSIHKHYGPVWAVEWRESYFALQQTEANATKNGRDACNSPKTAREVGLSLVSVSEDGTVKEWFFFNKQILRCTTLIKVSVPPWVSLDTAGGLHAVLGVEDPDGGPEAKEGSGLQGPEKQRKKAGLVLPVTVPATAISFRPNDSTTYMLGTVAGELLMCRTFERQGCFSVFRGHSALVTRVAWRPPSSQGETGVVFLSAALDETVRIWHVDRKTAQSVLKNPQAAAGPGGYVDACWCPWQSTLLAAVHGGGIHLWDVSLSTHTPVLARAIPGASCVAFSAHTRNLAVGDRHGAVSVIHLQGVESAISTGFYKFSVTVSKITICTSDILKIAAITTLFQSIIITGNIGTPNAVNSPSVGGYELYVTGSCAPKTKTYVQ